MCEKTQKIDDLQNLTSGNFAQVMRIRGCLSTEQLRTALDGIRGRHPRMLQRVSKDNSLHELPLEKAPIFPLQVLTDCKDDDWADVVSKELFKTFPIDGPFARFVCCKRDGFSDLIIICDHIILDGMSGVYALRDVLHLLSSQEKNLPPLPIPPNIITLLPREITHNFITSLDIWLKISLVRVYLSLKRLLNIKSTPLAEEQSLSKTICILTRSLSVSQTSALAAYARAENTSLHAAICVAWLKTYAMMLKDRKSWVRTVSSPVSLRERLSQQVEDTAGFYMTTVNTSVDCSPERNFWQVAREFKEKLNCAISGRKLLQDALLFQRFISQFRGQVLQVFQDVNIVNYDFSITNLGKLDFPTPKNGSLEVNAFYNLVNTSDGEMTVSVNSLGGKLNFALLYRRAKMDSAQAEQLMERVVELLCSESNIKDLYASNCLN